MITVELQTEELDRVLARLSAALTDQAPLMGLFGDYMVSTTQDRIQRGEQPDGQAFAPRSQTTLDLYAAANKRFGQPLNQSGKMRKGIAYNAGPDWMEIGSNAIQAAVMQFGAEQGSLGSGAPWGDIPARPFLGVSDEDELNLINITTDWLNDLVQD